MIFRLLLLEKKILFIDNDYEQLSTVSDGFISLLYPFQWIHTYIPIMSDQMIQYLQTFLPFINGIHETLLPFVQETLIENEDEVYMIYLESDELKRKPKSRIDLNRNLLKKKINVDDKINELAETEHNRWNVEKLMIGYRSATDVEKKQAQRILNMGRKRCQEGDEGLGKEDLKDNFIHIDIRPFDELDMNHRNMNMSENDRMLIKELVNLIEKGRK